MKGTDHKGSLGPDGVWRMVRDIRLLEMSLGKKDIIIETATESAKKKLERSIATKRTLEAGHIINEDDVHLLSPGDGFKWSEKGMIIGKKLKNQIPENELIYPKDIE